MTLYKFTDVKKTKEGQGTRAYFIPYSDITTRMKANKIMWVTTAPNQEKALPENLKKEHNYSGIKWNGAMVKGTP